MTYCIAWKSIDAVFMTSDSVITKTGDPKPLNKETSSLGELSISSGNVKIEEGINKIYRISNDLLISFAGDVSLFFQVFENIKKYFYDLGPLKAIELGINSVRTTAILELQLLIGLKSNDNLHLYSFNTFWDNQLKEHNDLEFVHIGSLSSTNLGERIKNTFSKNFTKENSNSFINQIYLHFLIQSYSIYEPTMEVGVGGLYNSAFITKKDVNFIDDTSIIIYEPLANQNTIIPIGICNYFNRWDAFIYNSTISNSKEIFIPDSTNFLYQNADAQNFVEEYSNNYTPGIIAFYSSKTQLVSIFIMKDTSKYFILTFKNGKIELQVTQDCLNLLLKTNPSAQIGFNVQIDV